MRHILDISDVDALFAEDLAMVYKHSPTCGICAAAAGEVGRFVERHPSAALYQVDVLAARPLSRDIAARAGVTHESPQVILLRKGAPVWHASHYAITAEMLSAQYEAAGRQGSSRQ